MTPAEVFQFPEGHLDGFAVPEETPEDGLGSGLDLRTFGQEAGQPVKVVPARDGEKAAGNASVVVSRAHLYTWRGAAARRRDRRQRLREACGRDERRSGSCMGSSSWNG